MLAKLKLNFANQQAHMKKKENTHAQHYPNYNR